MSSTLNIPPVPDDLDEYRSKIWVEVHMLRTDFHRVEMLEAEVGELREDINTAKTWARAFGVFLSSVVAVLEYIRRSFP
tara:strand:- start:692 stop:928 length:237 start_codon:yes stop_codon:yes gene_type:complete